MKRILVPVDFSAALEGVLQQARLLADAFRAELHLVHVRELAAVPVFPAATIGIPGVGIPEIGLAMGAPEPIPVSAPNDEHDPPLETLRQDLTAEGQKVVAHEREGAVVEEILQCAEEISADLIVMGSHGHGSVYNLLVGSVTEGVLHAGQRPVLLVPAPAPAK